MFENKKELIIACKHYQSYETGAVKVPVPSFQIKRILTFNNRQAFE